MLVNGKCFFEMQIKNAEETYEQIIEMGRNDGYRIRNLLDYEYFSRHCKLIAIDLSKQVELENSDLKQQIDLLEELKEMKEQQCFSSFKYQNKRLLNLYKMLQELFDFDYL